MKKIVLSLLVCLALSAFAWFQTEDTNAKVKAVFLYNFTKYIEWPKTYKEGNFVVGILSNYNTFFNELNKMSVTKNVGNQKIEIRNINTFDAIGKCHILYVTADKAGEISEITKRLKGKSTLIITEKPGLAKMGAGINFIVKDNKQRFELNKANIERYNLKVSQNLMTLAIVVE